MKKIQLYVPIITVLILLQSYLAPEGAGGGSGDVGWLTTFVTFFVAILLEAMPFVLIGSVISGAIEVFVPREMVARWVPRNRIQAVLMFGLLGIVFPICECGIVPIIRRLLKKGVPLSCGITYLLAAPIVQPIVFVSTLIAFNGSWKVALLRTIGGYAVAVMVGMLSTVVLDPRAKKHVIFESEEHAHEHCDCGCEHEHEHQHEHGHDDCGCGDTGQCSGFSEKFEYVLSHAAEDFFSTGSYLILGAFLAAGMQTAISQDMLSKLGHGPIVGPLVMMAIAFSLSLCSEADAFVAAAFTQFPIAARMAFLVMGPMVDIKLVAMYNGFLSKKATWLIFGSAAALALAYAVVIRLLGV